jgi:membrane-associated phospholipid phosphatase
MVNNIGIIISNIKIRMIKKLFIFVAFVALIYFLLMSLQPQRYNMWYPTIHSAYPNNAREIGIMVRDYFHKRTPENIQFFKLTDASPLEAFHGKITDAQFQLLKKKIKSSKIVGKIMYYKKLYNRARPVQLAPEIVDAFYSTTANTASYPSGHAFQAYYAAKLLSKWIPERKKEWGTIAERCANIRIIAGLHYPSDRDFARRLVDNLKDNI